MAKEDTRIVAYAGHNSTSLRVKARNARGAETKLRSWNAPERGNYYNS